MVNAWKEPLLPTLLSNYDLKDTHNADELVLCYKSMTNKTCQLQSKIRPGGKLNKVRITGMAAASAVGDKKDTNVCD